METRFEPLGDTCAFHAGMAEHVLGPAGLIEMVMASVPPGAHYLYMDVHASFHV